MIEFRLSPHPVRSRPVVELWRDGRLLASFYAHEDRETGVTIVSRGAVRTRHTTPATIEIAFAAIAELSPQK